MMNNFICRNCETAVISMKDSGIPCQKCGIEMELVNNPVTLIIRSINNPGAKTHIERLLFKIYVEKKIKTGVFEALAVLPSKVLKSINPDICRSAARKLKELDVDIQVISDKTGADITAKILSDDDNNFNKTMKVLIVEDVTITRRFLSQVVQKIYDAEIVEAKEGAEAAVMLSKYTFDVVITDLNMPVMDGSTLIRHIRSTEGIKDLPVVVISTISNSENIKKIMQMNISGYILKPFDEKRLTHELRPILDAIMNIDRRNTW